MVDRRSALLALFCAFVRLSSSRLLVVPALLVLGGMREEIPSRPWIVFPAAVSRACGIDG